MLDRNIEAMSDPTNAGFAVKTQHTTAGIGCRWPGVVLLLAIVIGGVVAITFAALHTHTASTAREEAYAKRKASASAITGGASGSGSDLVSDDGEVGNPKSYPDMGCQLPDYQSKDGHIYAVASNGTEVAVDIKGINWFGMETGTAIPLGLWDNSENGTTAYQIVYFLEKNKFNAVRLPLCINWILKNQVPESTLINTAENRAISIKNYMSCLKASLRRWHTVRLECYSVCIPLHRRIVVDFGTATTSRRATSWTRCTDNWKPHAERLFELDGLRGGNLRLSLLTIDDTEYSFYDWYGSGLQKANEYPVELTTENKVVYAPHYYTPAVYPQTYLYGGGTSDDNGALEDYVELSNSTLKTRISATMDDMFGFIADNKSAALLLGEFGGLYATDMHPELTTKRCTDYSIDIMVENGWAGGFVWSLNPESAYQYNPADTYGTFTEGVLEDDWLTANSEFLQGLEAMNDLEHLRYGLHDAFPHSPPSSATLISPQASAVALAPITRREQEREYGMESSASLITSSEMLGSPTYNYSAMLNREDSSDIPDQDYIPQPPAREVFREPSEAQTYGAAGATMWPGIVLIILVVGGAVAGITLSAVHASDSATTRQEEYAQRKADSEKISGGASGSGSDLVSDDGAVGNPKSYPDMGCELPDYQSKNGRIVAVSANGTEVPVDIKGINWFGMETGTAIPLGLWDNADNGTTAYQIASFLADNKFNAVRLPLCVNWILTNPKPETTLINTAENRAISVKNYMSLLKSIVKVLAYRKIGVLLKRTFEGYVGDGSDTDFHAGAKKIANRMLNGCSNWMGFVEGINADHTVTIDGTKYDYYDWYGGGLQDAADYPLTFSTENKVVYAPHYYTPAVYPQSYFYDGGTQDSNGAIADYVEIDDDTLKSRIKATMADMFGFLADDNSSALLLGEFGGLYSKDLHPELTTQRCTDLSMEVIVESGWAGGFVWSLNPESAYQYNPADTYGTFTEGILEDDWLTANSDFLKGMTALNDLANLRSMPCFEVEESSSGSDSSSSS
ncbi:Glycoside hydrolase superfamily [Phytophthora cactorum]|nr:Glycoside hydrolase superfamily [Phytophthora cactorum]